MKYKIVKDILTQEECEELINRKHEWVYDPVIGHDGHEFTQEQGMKIRKVLQSPIEHIFPEWDGLKVLGTKVMKYEVGDFVKEHRDRTGMLHSDCYEPGLDLRSKDLMIIPLNNNYEGGVLTVDGNEIPQDVGSLIQIPQPEGDVNARPKHGISEVTKGTRYSLVFWNFN
jgi:hypothetical protein